MVQKFSRLWDWSDLSEFLHVPIPTLKKWHFQRRLPSLRFGPGRHALIRFRPEEVIEWVEKYKIMGGDDGR